MATSLPVPSSCFCWRKSWSRPCARLAETRQILQLYDRWFLDRLPSGERLGRPMTPQLEEIFHTIGLPEE